MTAKIMKEIEAIKITLARVIADKLGWWRATVAMSAVVVTMFSALITATAYLDGKIEATRAEQQQTRTEIAEVKTEVAVLSERQIRIEENQVRIEDKLDMIIKQNRAILGDSDPTLIETPVDAPVNAPYYTTPNPTPKPKENYNVPL